MTNSDSEYEKKYEAIVKDQVSGVYTRILKLKFFYLDPRARGDAKRGSDCDIGVDAVDYNAFRKLEMKFDDLWEESIVPFKVDFVFFGKVTQDFKIEAEKNIVIWKTD